MRKAFVAALLELAERDPSIVLLTGDLGFTVLEPIAERFPERFFNVGVAEQNMIGLATGLARSGFKPYAYSIATFASMRAYEFVRNGPVLHELPVRIVGVGGGFDYGQNGPTHFALEDIGLMRLQPELAVVAPADDAQASQATAATADLPGPVYMRLAKSGEEVPGLDGRFALGRAELIGDGDDAAIITYGGTSGEAVKAARLLGDRGIRTTVVIAACLAPAPVEDLASVLSRVPLAVSLEGHYTVGGVGSLVSEIIAERGLGCRLLRRGAVSLPRGCSGSQSYLERRYGLTAEAVADAALQALEVTRA